jgi:Calcineurin-like phosphoesterase
LARELAGTPTIVTLCADIGRKSALTNESILQRPGQHLGHEPRSLANMSLRGKRGELTSAENADAFLFRSRGNKWVPPSVSFLSGPIDGRPIRSETMAHDHDNQEDGVSRRHALECMLWAGTGVLWTVAGGVPTSLSLLGQAEAATAASSFTFLQISDSHVGFDKAANPNALGTLQEAIAKVKALPNKPAFMIHTGDITHLSKPKQFDDANQVIGGAGLDVHYVPGEHDNLDDVPGKSYLERYGKSAKGSGWYSFDQNGVHFIGLVNVMNLKAGGMGMLGPEQLAWLADDVKGLSASTPIVVFAHIPLWTISKDWGWGTDDSEQALSLLKGFGSVTVLNGHIHQLMQKVEGHVTFYTARSTAFPQPAPGTAPAPTPLVVPADKLRSVLGIRTVDYTQGKELLAITDQPLASS